VRLVLVEWLDSRRGEGWTRLEDIQSDCLPTKCRSVGWIVFKDSNSITIAGHLGENPQQCCGDMTIPNRSIVRIQNLSLVARRKS
jgi:hypothetical protein